MTESSSVILYRPRSTTPSPSTRSARPGRDPHGIPLPPARTFFSCAQSPPPATTARLPNRERSECPPDEAQAQRGRGRGGLRHTMAADEINPVPSPEPYGPGSKRSWFADMAYANASPEAMRGAVPPPIVGSVQGARLRLAVAGLERRDLTHDRDRRGKLLVPSGVPGFIGDAFAAAVRQSAPLAPAAGAACRPGGDERRGRKRLGHVGPPRVPAFVANRDRRGAGKDDRGHPGLLNMRGWCWPCDPCSARAARRRGQPQARGRAARKVRPPAAGQGGGPPR